MNGFEIRDPAIDADLVKRTIAERIETRRAHTKEHSLDFEKLSRPVSLAEFNQATAPWLLNLIGSRQASILVEPYSSTKTNQGWPGWLMGWVKKPIHNLAIYYVNRLGKKQILFNESVTWAVALHQARLEKLQAQVAALEQTIQNLEAQLATREGRRSE
jgi:hypothetical protein